MSGQGDGQSQQPQQVEQQGPEGLFARLKGVASGVLAEVSTPAAACIVQRIRNSVQHVVIQFMRAAFRPWAGDVNLPDSCHRGESELALPLHGVN